MTSHALKEPAPYLNDQTPLADTAQCQGERTARELPPAIQLYGPDIGSAIVGAGTAWMTFMVASMERRADKMQEAATEIAKCADEAKVLANFVKGRLAAHRQRNPNVRD